MAPASSRRRFLKSSALLAVGAAAARLHAEPSRRVVLGVMGVNGRGTSLARGFARLQGVEVGYVCDVDERAVASCAKAVSETGGRAPNGVKDFRRILDDKSVDALVVAAPDHWHAPAGILAASAGKHVYVEKPCSHNAREGELLVAAARQHGRSIQMGNQRRSYPKVMEAMRRLGEGVIGRVYHSRAWYASLRGSIGRGQEAPVPSWLDFDLWQGPAPRRPYRDNLLHYNWHWMWHWGTGELGNNGVHAVDLSRWGLGVDYPLRVVSGGGRYRFEDDQETPDTQTLVYEFEGRRSIALEILSCSGHGREGTGFGASFHGENGTLVLTDASYVILDPQDKEVERVPVQGGDAPHFENFLAAVRGTGEPLRSEIEEGHKTTILCHLGNIAHRTGRALRCDPSSGRIQGDTAAAALWGREYADGWAPGA